MISVAEALEQLFALVEEVDSEIVPLRNAAGRVLAKDAVAARTQPPFAASAMDGYALRATEVEPDAMFKVIGEAAAGHAFDGRIGPGQCTRIFTGAPVPEGADQVVLQEDVTRRGDLITLGHKVEAKSNIRPAGGDFKTGDALKAPRVLSPSDIALLASMNIAEVPVARAPTVAIVATGDELVAPGEDPGPDQIIASNSYGLAALLEKHGATCRLLPIARDTEESLTAVLELAASADLIVTIGGASVGDHDLVAPVAEKMGMERAFYKVAMRPGKPLMAGRLGAAAMVGLPGNPVSAMVCGTIFVVPLLRAMLGLGRAAAPRRRMQLAQALSPNGPREHYMRACITAEGLIAFDRQDSSLLSILSSADALLVRPPHAPEQPIGALVEYIDL